MEKYRLIYQTADWNMVSESEYIPNELQKRKEKSLIVLALHKLHYLFPESSELDIIQTQGKWPMASS